MIPTATLRLECAQTNPPKPLGCAVMVDGKMIAVVTLDELKRARAQLEELEAAYIANQWRNRDGAVEEV